ncbi:MAG TPA: molybdenum ABC transporter ATP-binding protein [Spongiibacteraceae bacterium]|nr:molybdenum ABC transporter ATP-binding protein [Spongiibacteraceae bacterium]HUH37619.1 molybdenum ABC transporter ATP-binding protein [Spongiibacteraceae bacterium]
MSEALALRFLLRYADFCLDVDLQLPGAGVTALFGHSGSGKTSLLRCIAGLTRADEGRLVVNGAVWQDATRFLPTHKRPLGYVFQEPSLFAHLSVEGNLRFALRRAGRQRSARPALSHDDVVALLGIGPFLHRSPAALSGGERQRVAIARALLINPSLLLMDEPLASLDMARKQEILPYLERLRSELSLPILYVSHAADEVARLADHLVVLDQGRVVACGPLRETLARVDFPIQLGDDTGVVWDAAVDAHDREWQLARARCAGGALWLRDSGYPLGRTLRLRVLARDVSLALQHHTDTSILNVLPAVVTDIAVQDDASALVRLDAGGAPLLARLTRRSVGHLQLAVGTRVWAQIKSVALIP